MAHRTTYKPPVHEAAKIQRGWSREGFLAGQFSAHAGPSELQRDVEDGLSRQRSTWVTGTQVEPEDSDTSALQPRKIPLPGNGARSPEGAIDSQYSHRYSYASIAVNAPVPQRVAPVQSETAVPGIRHVRISHAGDMTAQRRTFIAGDTANPQIRQTGTRATPWTEANAERTGEQTNKVVQFKRQILTWIAGKIRPHLGFATPHVAVVINRKTLYVAVNSLPANAATRTARRDVLRQRAEVVRNDLVAKYAHVRQHYGHEDNVQQAGDPFRTEQEALYVTLRWAAAGGADNGLAVVAQDIPSQGGNKGAIHGEMNILEGRTGARVGQPDLANQMRVLWVGGTKTPCYDCGEVMGLHGHAEDDNVYHPDWRVRSVNGENRRVWTNQSFYGKGFPNWRGPVAAPAQQNRQRTAELTPDLVQQPNYREPQAQTTTELTDAMVRGGCAATVLGV